MTRPNPDAMKDFHSLDEYKQALNNFSDESSEKGQDGLSKSPNPLVDEYFYFVAAKGATFTKWSLVRPAFIWKIKVGCFGVTFEHRTPLQIGHNGRHACQRG